MPELRKRLALDLADPLARYAEFASDLLERARMAVLQTEAQAYDLALALCQTTEHLPKLLLQHREACRIGRHDGRLVQLDVTLRNVCPNKRGALAAILTEVDNAGMEYKRGLKTMVVPAHNRDTCRDVTGTDV